MKRVLYSYFERESIGNVVKVLDKEHGWKPVFFHGDHIMGRWVKDIFPEAVFADGMSLRQGKFNYTLIGDPIPIDKDIIDTLSPYALNYLGWIQDTTGWNFSFAERRQYYYDILKYWNTVICNLKPDIFAAYTMPHLPSDHVLYLLCKHYYKIPVLFLSCVASLDRDLYAIYDSMENLSSPFESIYFGDDELQISDVVEKYLNKLRSSKPQAPWHIQRIREQFDTHEKDFCRNEWKKFLKMAFQLRLFERERLSFKKNKMPWGTDRAIMTYWDFFWWKMNLLIKNKKTERYYKIFSEPVPAGEKYIYFAAPYQPEILSNLVAGIYENVFIILDMLSSLLPKGWKIYYKEHPDSFRAGDRNVLMRSKNFYERVSLYEDLRIIPFEISPFELIDNSRAVCTVGGTVGWEAIVRGKPALVYGSLWYQSCQSVFTINKFEDLEEAIDKITEGYVPDPDDVDRYAEAIYRVCYKGFTMSSDEKSFSDVPEDKITEIAESFFSEFCRYYE